MTETTEDQELKLPRPDVEHTTEQAAAALGVPPGTIRAWKARGRAKPAGLIPAAVPGGLAPLWMLSELRPLADAYHAAKAARAAARDASTT